MMRRKRYFTLTHWVALMMLGGGALGTLAALAILVGASWLIPEPAAVGAVAAPATWVAAATPAGCLPPTLADFRAGCAAWQLDVPDAGLPIGKSDTRIGPAGKQ